MSIEVNVSKFKYFLISTFFCISSLSGQAEEPLIVEVGFVTGNTYRAMSEIERTSYIMGVVDGLFLSPFLKSPSSESKKLKECLAGMENTQIVAIVERQQDQNPQNWHTSMHFTVWRALNSVCFNNS